MEGWCVLTVEWREYLLLHHSNLYKANDRQSGKFISWESTALFINLERDLFDKTLNKSRWLPTRSVFSSFKRIIIKCNYLFHFSFLLTGNFYYRDFVNKFDYRITNISQIHIQRWF